MFVTLSKQKNNALHNPIQSNTTNWMLNTYELQGIIEWRWR
jgi:hypothetical protein